MALMPAGGPRALTREAYAVGIVMASCSTCEGTGTCQVCRGSGDGAAGATCGHCAGTGKCRECGGNGTAPGSAPSKEGGGVEGDDEDTNET